MLLLPPQRQLQGLATEKGRPEGRVTGLEAILSQPVDVDAVMKEGLASLQAPPRPPESVSPEARKKFVTAFVSRVTVDPDEWQLTFQMKRLPVADPQLPGVPSVGVVAGPTHRARA